ncbi:hypothetical protein Q5P01_025439 [Channa striata]|uniref:LRAT domain-containing protein n=1 Tax=Channa striata TaxID=64152 RepID=A0AA88IWS3_CHASR|nr:hypothetical protein Q5P01_025439 [Channa striata]
MWQLVTFLVEKLSLFSSFRLLEPSRRRPARGGAEPRFRRGDLLEVPRSIFTHFGVYLGDNRVAHLIPDVLPALTADRKLLASAVSNKRLIAGCICRRASVRVDTLEDFAHGASARVSRAYRKRNAQAFPAETVARRAEKQVGASPYSLLWNNCEHFVTYCKYGSAESRQTDKFCEGLKSAVRDLRSVVAAGLLGIFSTVYFGLAPSTALPTVLIPFTLWMAG